MSNVSRSKEILRLRTLFKGARLQKKLSKEVRGLIFTGMLFHKYMDNIIHSWSKTLAVLGVILVPAFFILDFFTMPEELLSTFAMYRISATAIIIFQFFFIKFTKPSSYSLLHGYFFSFVVGLAIIMMTVDLGGIDSPYYAGLNLVIIAANVLVSWHWIHSAINGIFIILLYLGMNFIHGGEYSITNLINNLYFMGGTVVITTSVSYVRYRLLFDEFSLRFQLKEARDALWGEMEIAKRIQTSLLPSLKEIGGYQVASVMIPASEVGGDYYDIIETRHNDHWITIGDVSGHGVESGLIMMMTQTSIATALNHQAKYTPSALISDVNSIIIENISRLGVEHYMTISVLRLEEDQIIAAGAHQDILIYRKEKNTLDTYPVKGTWIGITTDIESFLEDKRIAVGKGDIVLLFTDGITEARNADHEMYGQARLEQKFLENAGLPLEKILDVLLEDVKSFSVSQEDDITLVIFSKM